ncbi:E3 ubiquitin-protein ligase At1g63170-like isoform X2 [Malania oleifera]|uniref:E3 ubiquitin-protein ligase At1g63170-like isoform X2 n=1 Tax=Malania oleifera TaxID=397392 RepID=UPI0025AE492E|nr:E3 ubiquitin-protein ligase At1g63170-like isoform X2 [Malania oleifera]XP_057968412.1 E3 ubiquitin-protein ligase At1g63170-like isoform X2 [Malania oleifera]XP_057968413.1 E3 ubiquitin-protein ligase At1g63170-like isoform X2 [Malania oleifera]XP_057968414.1 E3 ubiquitin-protein ligase At1g63170-like isoform X2 [Malania oleifera]
MAVTSQEPVRENQTDRHPLLMEQPENNESHEHIVDVVRGTDASSLRSSDDHSPHESSVPHAEERQSSHILVPINQSSSSSSNGSNSRVSSLMRRSDEFGPRQWSPFNCGLWIFIEFVFTISQIIASIVVLYVSRHEKPQAPLFSWIVGYAAGRAASLPVLYWRCLRRSQRIEQSSTQSHQGSSRDHSRLEPNSYITISLTPSSEEEDRQNASTATSNGQTIGAPNPRLGALMDHYKMALDCFFAVWFVVGNVWIFGGHASSSDAPNLYRLCIVFLTFSCIGYAMPFILCAIICCCLPCIISILGREDLNQMRGATAESINALPTYKFKLKKVGSGCGRASSGEDDSGFEGGVVAAGTERERAISAEDAVGEGSEGLPAVEDTTEQM